MLSAAMHAIFRAPGGGAIPVYFIDAASFGVERDGLDQAAWTFRPRGWFRSKAGPRAAAPREDRLRRDWRRPVWQRSGGSIRARAPARHAAARNLPVRQCARSAARDARLRARQLSVCPLPQGRRAQGRPRAAGEGRRGRRDAHHRGRVPRPRPDQHADQRHGAGRARSGGALARHPTRRQRAIDRRRRFARREFSVDPRGRARLDLAAAAD